MGELRWIARPAPDDGGRDGGNANQFTIKPSLENLSRETIQNSNDEALEDSGLPVEVTFRLVSLRGEAKQRFLDALRWDQLEPHIAACVAQSSGQQAASGLGEAIKMANSEELCVLQIIDRNTRGLIGPETGEGNFAALTRDNLFSHKNRDNAGGSYGLGKAMQYAASAFSCVLFSSELSEPEPDTQKRHGRFFARCELVYHTLELDGEESEFSGPMWLGLGHENKPDRPVSYWSDGDTDQTMIDLLMQREEDEPGTTIAIVGVRDLDSDEGRPARDMIAQIRQDVERNFWPAIVEGELNVKTEYVEIEDPTVGPIERKVELADPGASGEVGPLVQAIKAFRSGNTVDQLSEAGEVIKETVTLNVPRQKAGEDQHPPFEHEAVLLLRLATGEEESDAAGRRNLGKAFRVRSANMVVDWVDLSNSVFGAPAFQAIVLAGEAAGEGIDFKRADRFLKYAEPPSHDRWERTKAVKDLYAQGGKKGLDDIRHSIRQKVREILQIETDIQSDGPEDLAKKFSFGGGGTMPAGERAPTVAIKTRSIGSDGSWCITGEIKIPNAKKHLRTIRGQPELRFLGESGGGKAVSWKSLTVQDDGVQVDDGHFRISPGLRRFTFEGETDADTHPAPADQTAASISFVTTADQV